MNDPTKFQQRKLQKYLHMIESRIVRANVAPTGLQVCEPAAARFDAPGEGEWRPFAVGGSWGARQQWTWFRARFRAPAGWDPAATRLHLRHRLNYLQRPGDDNWPAGPEGQVFVEGKRVGAIDLRHHAIDHPFEPGRDYEVGAVFFAGRCECRHALETFNLSLVDRATEKLFFDLQFTLDVALNLDAGSPHRERLLRVLETTIHHLDFRDTVEIETPLTESDCRGDLFYASVLGGRCAFDEAWRALPAGGDGEPGFLAVGHAHIDLAWLWPISQARHKCVRTFSTQCRLFEQYPDWIFLQSSPQVYAWVEENSPDLFVRIREWVARGRWDADGAAWVEFDTNLTSGESIVRQFLYGKRYFREKLGVESRLLWLPDVFGYSAALPQLMKLAGVNAFVTSKLSWNQYNAIPHDTFRWRGLDGTEIPTYFITTPTADFMYTYNGSMTVEEARGSYREYKDKDLLLGPILSFGWGDGGGGPTEKMLECVSRLASMPAMPGFPRARFEKPSAYLDRVAADAEQLPIWDGELYLEFHRGTYTTQAWLKRANRKNEIRLHQAEGLASLAADSGFSLDKAALDEIWKDLLLLQFHDILPGSSVGEVYYDEVRPMQERIARRLDVMIAKSAGAIARRIDTSSFKTPIVFFNTLSWEWSAPLRMSDGSWRDDIRIPAWGWAVAEAAPSDAAKERADVDAARVSDDGQRLENRYWKLEMNADGTIARLFDRQNDREVLAPGAVANQWQVFEDRPMAADAWDIDAYYKDYPLPSPVVRGLRVVERGPVRAAVEVAWEMPTIEGRETSRIVQTIALYAKHPRIDFETGIEWHEHHQLLKVAFPVDIRARTATYQIAFGHVTRPTHRNTSWEFAQFEVPAHGFADLGESGYGVALLNDCKYGYDILNNCIRLTSIKSPQSPDARADQGHHEFIYTLLPHRGSFQEADVIRATAELNVPPVAVPVSPPSDTSKGGERLPTVYRFVCCREGAVVLDTLKPAEDKDGLILRLYESHGSHSPVHLEFAETPGSVEVVNLLEEPTEDDIGLLTRGSWVSFRVKPFQVVTLRLRHAQC